MLHKTEGLQELIDVNVAILVEVNAPGKVTDAVSLMLGKIEGRRRRG